MIESKRSRSHSPGCQLLGSCKRGLIMKGWLLPLASVGLLCLCVGQLGCSSTNPTSTVTPVQKDLSDAVSYADNNIAITNTTEWVWTNVWLLMNGTFICAYGKTVDPHQTITVPANEFMSNGTAFDPSTTKAWTIKVLCDLGNGKRGEFSGSWHQSNT
jgi:hypothetical protein